MSGLSLSHEPVTGVPNGKLARWIFLASEIRFFTGFVGAFIVIGSSLTMALSILNLEKGNTAKFRLFLGLTILCGFGFLIVKSIEYSTKFGHHIFPWTNVFFSFYFIMTGFHALHVIAGMIPMFFMFIKSFTKKGYNHPAKVETLGLYWHFVDLVWIFLFPVLYLIFPSH